jgi:prepilin-type N-terminal cleavage/methylation domain-containing protein
VSPTKRLQASGFTLIELMLALAVSGLIIAIVFLAVPTVQRQNRDDRRKADLSEIASRLEKFKETPDYSAGYYPSSPGSGIGTGYITGCPGVTVFQYFFDPSTNLGCGSTARKYALPVPQGIDPRANTQYLYDPTSTAPITTSHPAEIRYKLGFACGVTTSASPEKSDPNWSIGAFRLEMTLEVGETYCIDNVQSNQ